MMKRLVLIFAIGIAFGPTVFAPAAFADGGDIGAFTRQDGPGQSLCEAGGVTSTKHLDDPRNDVNANDQTSGTSLAGALDSSN